MGTERSIRFSEFEAALTDPDLRQVTLEDYIELDPDSPRLKLRFRDDALIDNVPPDFNLDDQIYQHLQELDEEEYEAVTKLAAFGLRTIVGEGDSWMNLPGLLRWEAIGDSIKKRRNFRIRNIGKWGHTLEEMLDEKQYMRVIDSKKPDYFIFSGGGNDLQDKLAAGGVIKEYDPDLDPDDYLTEDGDAELTKIAHGYQTLLKEVTDGFPHLRVFTHSYDYPKPLVGRGRYLGQHLRDRGIPDELMSPILNQVVLRLDSIINDAASAFESVIHVRLLGITGGFLWRDDFHPKNKGFDAIAQAIELAINQS